MSEAEKKWEEWDNEFTSLEGPTPAKCYKYSREAYKSALRREIEKLIDFETEGSEWDAAIDTVLKLLDTVEP